VEFFVIGEEEIVLGFQFVGVQGTAAYTREEILEAFEEAVNRPEVRVLILTEDAALEIADRVMEWQLSGRYPLVVDIPGLEGHSPRRKTLLQSIREAVGISV
jgi:vacuolar-type H+-ATPase subunit F/Vma7